MTPRFEVGECIAGFRIEGEIGRGGMGVVYKARQLSLERLVALKCIPEHLLRMPEMVARFKREALAIARLKHPGIVQIHDYYQVEGQSFYVMEYLDAHEWRSLREVLDQEVMLPLDRALRIVRNLLEALQAAHDAQVLHRDIKPGNIMVNHDDEVKVLDFGIAELRGQTQLTADNLFRSGTVDYMSPEQGEGGQLDQRSDLYSVGTILYEMLTGMLPYRADNAIAILHLRSERDPAPVRQLNPELPAEVEQLVSRAMARDREARYASARQMLKEVEAFSRKRPFLVAGAMRQQGPAERAGTDSEHFTLEINAEETRLRVEFNAQGEDHRTVTHYDYVYAERALLAELASATTAIVQKANRSPTADPSHVAELKRIGQRMYDQLLPLSAKTALRNSTAKTLILRLDDETVKIPWELLWDGQQFLCRRFQCGRLVTTAREVAGTPRRPVTGKAKFLVLSNPRGDLKAASEECSILKDQLAGSKTAQLRVRNARVSIGQVQEELREADVVHYSGHAQYDPTDPRKCGWLLSDGVFGPDQVRQLLGGKHAFPLLVFANACQSAVAEENVSGDPETRIFSVANAFLLAGVQNYIGTFAEVLDAHAAEFALRFYRAMLGGSSLGAALLSARESIVSECGEECLIWATYLMYGDPTRSIFPTGTTSPAEAFTLRPEAAREEAVLASRSVPTVMAMPAPRSWRRVQSAAWWGLAALVVIGLVYLGYTGLRGHLGGGGDGRWTRFQQYDSARRQGLAEEKFSHEKIMALLDGLAKDTPLKRDTGQDSWTSRRLGITIIPPKVFGSAPQGEGDSEYVTYSLMEDFSTLSRLKPVDRKLLDATLRELNLSKDGLTNPENAVRLGEMLSARLVVTGSLFYLPKGQVKAKFQAIDTETSGIVTFASAESSTGIEGLLPPLSKSLLAGIQQANPLQGRVVSGDNAQGLVLNIGRNQGVEAGMAFEVLPGDSDQVSEKVQVAEVQDSSCRAVVKSAPGPVAAPARAREVR